MFHCFDGDFAGLRDTFSTDGGCCARGQRLQCRAAEKANELTSPHIRSQAQETAF
jgi:hypothetical protein